MIQPKLSSSREDRRGLASKPSRTLASRLGGRLKIAKFLVNGVCWEGQSWRNEDASQARERIRSSSRLSVALLSHRRMIGFSNRRRLDATNAMIRDEAWVECRSIANALESIHAGHRLVSSGSVSKDYWIAGHHSSTSTKRRRRVRRIVRTRTQSTFYRRGTNGFLSLVSSTVYEP